MNGEINYKYSLELVQKINSIKYDGKPLNQTFIAQGVNYLAFFQQALLSEAKQFSRNKVIPTNTSLNWKGLFVSLFIFTHTALSIAIFCLVRRKIFIFSADSATSRFKSDFRIQEIYESIEKLGIKCWEIFHTVPAKKTIKNLMYRRRLSIYLQSIDFLHFAYRKIFFYKNEKSSFDPEKLDLNDVDDSNERKFLLYIAQKYIAQLDLSQFRVMVLSKIISMCGIKLVLAIDDTRNYNELTLACKINKVDLWAFQHGHYTKYHVGWLKRKEMEVSVRPSKLFVWSDYWKDELIRLGTHFSPESIIVGGKKKNNTQRRESDIHPTINILIPYETDAPKSEVKAYTDAMLHCDNVKIFFKIRPDMDESIQIREYSFSLGDVELVKDTSAVISKISLAVGVYSTFLYDMVSFQIPVAILRTSMDYGMGMVERGLADLLTDIDVCKQIKTIAHQDNAILSKRAQILEKPSNDFFQVFSEALNHGGYAE
jgi:hypothetical protein